MLQFIPTPPDTTNIPKEPAWLLASLHSGFCKIANWLWSLPPLPHSVELLICSLKQEALETLQNPHHINTIITYCEEQQSSFALFQKCLEKYKWLQAKFITWMNTKGDPTGSILALDLQLSKYWKADASYAHNIEPFTSIYHRFSLWLLLDICAHTPKSEQHMKTLSILFQDYIIQANGRADYQKSAIVFAEAITPYIGILRANITSRSDKDIAMCCREKYELSPLSAILSRDEFQSLQQWLPCDLPNCDTTVPAITRITPPIVNDTATGRPYTRKRKLTEKTLPNVLQHKIQKCKTQNNLAIDPETTPTSQSAWTHDIATENQATTNTSTPDNSLLLEQVIKFAWPNIFEDNKTTISQKAQGIDKKTLQNIPSIPAKFNYIFSCQREAYEPKISNKALPVTRDDLFLHLICIGKDSLSTKWESKKLVDYAVLRAMTNHQEFSTIPKEKSRDKIASLSLDLSTACLTNLSLRMFLADFCIPFRQIGMRFS